MNGQMITPSADEWSCILMLCGRTLLTKPVFTLLSCNASYRRSRKKHSKMLISCKNSYSDYKKASFESIHIGVFWTYVIFTEKYLYIFKRNLGLHILAHYVRNTVFEITGQCVISNWVSTHNDAIFSNRSVIGDKSFAVHRAGWRLLCNSNKNWNKNS